METTGEGEGVSAAQRGWVSCGRAVGARLGLLLAPGTAPVPPRLWPGAGCWGGGSAGMERGCPPSG